MDFLNVLKHISASGARFVIVGGVAARLHGSPRLTHDVDLVPDADPTRWRTLIDAIWETGARPRGPESKETISDIELVRSWVEEKSMNALSFRTPEGNAEIDLMICHLDLLAGLLKRAIPIVFERETFYVASIEDLIDMKRAAGRPQDLIDIEILERIKKEQCSEVLDV